MNDNIPKRPYTSPREFDEVLLAQKIKRVAALEKELAAALEREAALIAALEDLSLPKSRDPYAVANEALKANRKARENE
jgi:hypothetical protein